ncbi:hypothetical protein C0991_005433 [Blastosporella zonata]|nr:hypothetical protein C0991_005433 [Blastosporella zonata]
MNSFEVVETSDDEELELRWLSDSQVDIGHAEEAVDRHDGQSPRKRIKLYHDFEPMDLPYSTPKRSSSVLWPPTSSSSPRLLVEYSSPPSTAPIQGDADIHIQKDIHTEDDPSDILLAALSSPCRVFCFDDEEPPDIHQALSTPASPKFHLPSQLKSPSPDPMSLFDRTPSRPPISPAQAKQVTPAREAHQIEEDSLPPAIVSRHTGTAPPLLTVRLPNRGGPDPLSLFDTSSWPLDPLPSMREETPIHRDRRIEDTFSPATVPHHTTASSVLLTTPSSNKRGSPSPLQPMSPLTPLRGHTLSSPRNSPPYDLHPLILDDQTIAQHDESISDDTNIDMPNIPRYPLRQRNAAQLKPYTMDKLRYKNSLSGNPDAIVNILEVERINNDQYDHADDHPEDSQIPWQLPEVTQNGSDGEWSRSKEKPHSHEGSPPPRPALEERQIEYPEILQDLSSSDDEEFKSMRIFSKEAKRIAREKRKARLAQERQDKLAQKESVRAKVRARARAFPVKEPPSTLNASMTRSLSISADGSLPSQVNADTTLPPSPIASNPYPRISSPTSPPKSCSSSPVQFIDHGQMDDLDPQPSARNSADNSDAERDPSLMSDAEGEDEDDDENDPPVEKKDFKGAKILRRMYPSFMLKKLAAGPSISSKPKSKGKRDSDDLSGSENEENVVLPGRSRTAWSTHTWDKEIKGDTESSDDQRSCVDDSLSDDESETGPSFSRDRGNGYEAYDVVDLTGDLDDESEDDVVDDFDIQAYLAGESVPKVERASSSGRIRNESLIDWMLSGTRTVGRPRRPRTKKRPPDRARNANQAASSSKYKLDVTTHGGRRERQTSLNFDGHTRNQPASRSSGARRGAPSSRSARNGSSDVEANDHDRVHPVPEHGPARTKGRKKRNRERRAAAKGNGLHVFVSDNTQVVSGRRKRVMMTVNIEEDDGFLQAITPLSQDSTRPLQLARIVNTDFKKVPPPKQVHPKGPYSADESKPRIVEHCTDCRINVLRPGLSFSANSYIRKGWLNELISVVRLQTPPPPPMNVSCYGIELSPDTSVDGFSKSLKDLFDKLFDVVTSLIGIEDIRKEQEWLGVLRAATQLLSWLLAKATEAETKTLEAAVQDQISTFTQRMHDQSLGPSSLDMFTLSVCWFTVEISARLYLPSKNPESSHAFRQSATLLVNYLWEYGLDSVMDPIIDDTFPSGSNLTQYVTELWVSLLHLLDNHKDAGGAVKRAVHPFSSFLQEAWETAHRPSESAIECNEFFWRSIFSLCALSQFSVHGMTTSTPRLAACWGLVVHILKHIRLAEDPTADSGLSPQNMHKRDIFAQMSIERCFLLWNRWHWQLDEVSAVFDRLSKIFQSRNFSGLRHEDHNYPPFLLNNDWTALERQDPGDTAFVVFLKLLFQAVGCDVTDSKRTLSPKAKKMLSMAVSVTKPPYLKKPGSTTKLGLSMLFNRLSAVAIGIHLDPTTHAQRIKTARSYVDFSDVDGTARGAVIRGMICLAILLKNAKLPMEGISTWVEEIATAMANEYKAFGDPENFPSMNEDNSRLLGQLHICIGALVSAVRQILEAYQVDSAYPEPALLHALQPIFKISRVVDEPQTAEEIRKTLHIFLDARRKVLPPPEYPYRKKPVQKESQESQDEYPTIEIDYDDPDLLAALDVGGFEIPAKEASEISGKEETLGSYMQAPLSSWASRNLTDKVRKCTGTSPSKVDYLEFDRWIECWLGCADVAVHAGSNISWRRFLSQKDNWKYPEKIQRRLDFSAMKWLLKLDPMTYLAHEDVYMENLLAALVSVEPMDERDFICDVLELDGCQHLLLTGLSTEKQDIMDRVPDERASADILRDIINNLAGRLRDSTTSPVERDSLIEWCIKIYKAMARNLEELMVDSPERRKYAIWCLAITQTILGHRELYNEPRLSTWKLWTHDLK